MAPTGDGQSRNPFGICTWQDVSGCADCPIADTLNCRFNWGDLLCFLAGFLPPAIAIVAGMMRGGFGWYLVGWVGFMMFFFFVWEARVLCSHCPYWAEVGIRHRWQTGAGRPINDQAWPNNEHSRVNFKVRSLDTRREL